MFVKIECWRLVRFHLNLKMLKISAFYLDKQKSCVPTKWYHTLFEEQNCFVCQNFQHLSDLGLHEPRKISMVYLDKQTSFVSKKKCSMLVIEKISDFLNSNTCSCLRLYGNAKYIFLAFDNIFHVYSQVPNKGVYLLNYCNVELLALVQARSSTLQ